MTAQQVQQIISSFKEAGGTGWQALVQQQIVSGWVSIIWGCIGFVILVISGLLLLHFFRAGAKDEWESVTNFVGVVVFGFAVIILLIIAPISISNGITQVLAPGGSAIQALASS